MKSIPPAIPVAPCGRLSAMKLTGTTVEAMSLLEPLSQYCSPGGVGLVGQYNSPQGRNWYDVLEVKLNR